MDACPPIPLGTPKKLPELEIRRRPEPEFLKLCIERDMKMIGECLVEAGDLEKQAFRWSKLEGKLYRRAARGERRLAFARGNFEHYHQEHCYGIWKLRAKYRRYEANMCHRHCDRRTDKATKLRSLAERMQSNVTRCATRLRYLLV